MAEIPTGNLLTMQRRIGRRIFFLVPLSPKGKDGLRFYWGLSYTKSQNKNGNGFIFGKLNDEYLSALTKLVRVFSHECKASHVIVSGYSMGGFGAYQLGFHDPGLFDAVVSVAGYGIGTLASQNEGPFFAPQPASAKIFEDFLEYCGPRLARVRFVMVAHSPRDKVSSFQDATAIVEEVRLHGGHARLAVVPEEFANSDRGKKKTDGHHYFDYALLNETSTSFLYSTLLGNLQEPRGRDKPRATAGLAEPKANSGNVVRLRGSIASEVSRLGLDGRGPSGSDAAHPRAETPPQPSSAPPTSERSLPVRCPRCTRPVEEDIESTITASGFPSVPLCRRCQEENDDRPSKRSRREPDDSTSPPRRGIRQPDLSEISADQCLRTSASSSGFSTPCPQEHFASSSGLDTSKVTSLVGRVPSNEGRAPVTFCTQTDNEHHARPVYAEKDFAIQGATASVFGRWLDELGIAFTCKKGSNLDLPNQDSVCGVLHEASVGRLLGVFDGHGPNGHDVSHFATQDLIRFLRSSDGANCDPERTLRGAFADVQKHLDERAADAISSGSTVTMVLMPADEELIYVANRGDSRAFLCRLGERGVLEAMDLTINHARDHKHRNEAGLAAGLDVRQVRRQHGKDLFVLLCSNGVWQHVSSQEACKVIAKHGREGAKTALDELALLSSERGWEKIFEENKKVVDDITAVVVWCTTARATAFTDPYDLVDE